MDKNKSKKNDKVDKKKFIGGLAIIAAALLWSLDGVFIRPKFYQYPAALIVFLEHGLGLIFLSPFIIYNWSKIKTLGKKDWGAVLWVSFFGGLLGTLFITKAFFAAVNGEVTFATVVILQKLQPIFALVMARLILGEKLKKRFYIWAGVAIIAAYVLAVGKLDVSVININLVSAAAIFAIIAAFAFGSSTVLGKRLVNHLDFKTATALRFALTTVLALLFILVNRDIVEISNLSLVNWKYLFLIVFSSGAVALFIYYYGLKKVSASASTIFELFWPLSAVALDYFVNGSLINSLQIFASLVLLLSFYKIVSKVNVKEYEFRAKRIKGEGMGTKLGFPTINMDKVDIDISHGIYLVEARINNQSYFGLMHFGPKATFSDSIATELFLKEHIPTLDENDITISIKKKIRNIRKFNSVEDLQWQIKQDVKILK